MVGPEPPWWGTDRPQATGGGGTGQGIVRRGSGIVGGLRGRSPAPGTSIRDGSAGMAALRACRSARIVRSAVDPIARTV